MSDGDSLDQPEQAGSSGAGDSREEAGSGGAPPEADEGREEREASGRQLYTWPAGGQPLVAMEPVAPIPPRKTGLIPNVGHTAVFGLLLIPAAFIAYLVSIFIFLAIIHPHTLRAVMMHVQHQIRFAIAIQVVLYLVLWGLAALVFSLWWQRPFAQGVQWNFPAAGRWFFRLAGTGVLLGLVVALAGNFLPMPKTPPILEDIKESQIGAWMLFLFGISLAPLTEELAFRGFLLPSLINIFRWLERRGSMGEAGVRRVGIPLSIVLTSIPFALMHAQQVSFSWGPILLIGLVSVVLCIVRLRASSVAAGVVVHASYNFMLFAALLIQTDGFRHLSKLKG